MNCVSAEFGGVMHLDLVSLSGNLMLSEFSFDVLICLDFSCASRYLETPKDCGCEDSTVIPTI